MKNYSVLMSVYEKDIPKYLEESIESILNQSLKTDDFVIVKDGKLTKELENVLDKYKNNNIFNIISLPCNVGLGEALSIGIKECKNEFVARMDADDYSFPTRIEKQMNFLVSNSNIDIVGTQALEFTNDVHSPVQYNNFPLMHDDIVKYAHSRNPYSHPAVVFKKDKVISSGNYQKVYLCEDYDLWIRMIQNNCVCANLEECLVGVRISDDFFRRRGGFKYVKSINGLMLRNMKNGFFTKKDYLKNIVIRSTVYMMPNNLRSFVYKNFLRGGGNRL